MMLLLIIVLVLVVGVLVAVLAGRVGADSMATPTDTSAFELPDGPLGDHGVDSVRLDQSLRGYNMAQVDTVLDRLFDEIAELRAQVAQGRDLRPDTEVPGGTSVSTARAAVVPFRNRAGTARSALHSETVSDGCSEPSADEAQRPDDDADSNRR